METCDDIINVDTGLCIIFTTSATSEGDGIRVSAFLSQGQLPGTESCNGLVL